MARKVIKKKPAFFRSRRECYFTKNNIQYIDYKDTDLLFKYINDKGKIKSRRATGTKAIYQRELAIAIKRSRHMALMPFVKVTTK
ncbi:MAG: 30S ribosomal protein S18 [Mycoplasmatales bacterium]